MAAARRIAIGRLWQETNTFSELRTTLADFRRYTLCFGPEVLDVARSQADELAGFTDVLDGASVEYVPLVAASTWCGGPLDEDVVETVTSGVLQELRRAEEVDAVLFSMHGALASEAVRDVTGHVLSEIRATVDRATPIVVTLDHHANVTRAIVESSDVLTAYRHCPHTDMRETGRRGAQLLLRLMGGEFRPTVAFQKIPLLTPCEAYQTAKPPMKDWFDLARAMERRPGVIDASLFPVTPWFDAPEAGWSVVVTTNNDQPLADACAADLAELAWGRRQQFYFKKYGPEEAVRLAAAQPEGPVVLADGADATNGGSPGDSTCLLHEMLRQRITCVAMLTVVDPEAVRLAEAAGVGATIELEIGAKRSRRFHEPARVTATVARFADGRFTIAGHIAAKVNMGRCVLLEVGSIRIVVSEFAGPGHDPTVFRNIGLEPRDAQIVVVKATVGHMEAYRDVMKLNLPVECPGPSPSYLERLDYRHIPRPIYLFDADMTWTARD